jgi:hypothetical protein
MSIRENLRTPRQLMFAAHLRPMGGSCVSSDLYDLSDRRISPLAFGTTRSAPLSKWRLRGAVAGGVKCIPGAQLGTNPGADLLPQVGNADSPTSATLALGTGDESRPCVSSGLGRPPGSPGLAPFSPPSASAGRPRRNQNPDCQTCRPEPVLQRTSGTPCTSVTDHGCSRGSTAVSAWPLHIFMGATGSGGNLGRMYRGGRLKAPRLVTGQSVPSYAPARWSHWDRALLICVLLRATRSADAAPGPSAPGRSHAGSVPPPGSAAPACAPGPRAP